MRFRLLEIEYVVGDPSDLRSQRVKKSEKAE